MIFDLMAREGVLRVAGPGDFVFERNWRPTLSLGEAVGAAVSTDERVVRPEEEGGFFSVLLGDAAFRRLLGGALGVSSVAPVPFS
jgi:hypothetical protein